MITSLNRTRVAKTIGWLGSVLVWCVLLSRAHAEVKPRAAKPELLVLVSAGQNGVDQVAVTYGGEVGEAKARAQLRTLLRETGWPATAVVVDSQRLAPGTPKMTGVSFTAPAVVPYPEGTLPVAAFIRAYKQRGTLVLVFQMNRPFKLTGPGPYRDEHLSVGLQQGSGIYRYDVHVADPGFGALDLPPILAGGGTTGEPVGKRKRVPVALVVLLSIGVATSVGVAVYLLLAGKAPGKAVRPVQ